MSLTGLAATTTVVHPLFVGTGAVLILVALLRAAPRSAAIGAAGVTALAIGAV